ncbi:hypothetical protein PAP_06270 [Palaeococcus pacificus DY20341]|uniref:Undecaprenyl-diphosphatase n=1 Tax=Palaeococcus pacificus DY20341 TaxID=1343739 RepID=A0A075LUJ7_9EURY|nr:undecaprenyl-diphosphate phosphatase [Palaeococcus pacificus]AIF69652.1 hypothetical protein PAP_06270 [Palaeococcus pacificus DY20341]
MNYMEAVVMGVLQGITEWLPISSSGQTMLALMNFFGVPPEQAYSYALMLHLGTLMALAYKFRYDLGKILLKFIAFKWGEEEKFLFYSTLFTGLIGYPLYKTFSERVAGLNIEVVNGLIGVALIVTGLVLYKTQENPIKRAEKEKGLKSDDEVSIVESITAGIAQGIAVLPGISRSGMTIGALLLFGVKQEKAVRLSFLMAIPAIFGALFLEAPKNPMPINVAVVAVLSSFTVSLVMLEVMLKAAKRLNFSKFCILFGSIALIVSLLGVLL